MFGEPAGHQGSVRTRGQAACREGVCMWESLDEGPSMCGGWDDATADVGLRFVRGMDQRSLERRSAQGAGVGWNCVSDGASDTSVFMAPELLTCLCNQPRYALSKGNAQDFLLVDECPEGKRGQLGCEAGCTPDAKWLTCVRRDIRT